VCRGRAFTCSRVMPQLCLPVVEIGGRGASGSSGDTPSATALRMTEFPKIGPGVMSGRSGRPSEGSRRAESIFTPADEDGDWRGHGSASRSPLLRVDPHLPHSPLEIYYSHGPAMLLRLGRRVPHPRSRLVGRHAEPLLAVGV
jgi:hypothetical protein